MYTSTIFGLIPGGIIRDSSSPLSRIAAEPSDASILARIRSASVFVRGRPASSSASACSSSSSCFSSKAWSSGEISSCSYSGSLNSCTSSSSSSMPAIDAWPSFSSVSLSSSRSSISRNFAVERRVVSSVDLVSASASNSASSRSISSCCSRAKRKMFLLSFGSTNEVPVRLPVTLSGFPVTATSNSSFS